MSEELFHDIAGEVRGGVNSPVAVIIATKNRADAIQRYSLSSLAQSNFRDFICVIWDASDNDATQKIIKEQTWNFPVYYFRAPRVGSASQRNDAIEYILTKHPNVRFIVFIDDDSELSQDALGGVIKTFESTDASIVSLVRHRLPNTGNGGFQTWFRRKLGMKGPWMTEFLYCYGAFEAIPGSDTNWICGCGMAFKSAVFRNYQCFFPEPFQLFGGYAWNEDIAISSFLYQKMNQRIVNSVAGHFFHYNAPGGRLELTNWSAANWYNTHLLFEALYHDVHGLRKLRLTLEFKLYIIAAAVLRQPYRISFSNLSQIWCGIRQAKAALAEFHRKSDIQKLFQKNIGKGWED